MQLIPGQIFSEQYKLIEQIGLGGFSEVWKATDIKNSSLEVALKIYSVLDKFGEEQFSHEYADVFKISHQNLLTAKYYDSWQGSPYLVFPFCEKGSLGKLINTKSTLNKSEMHKVLLDIVSGLSYLHKKGMVHRDIKPTNILQNDDGEWMISDFGISVKTKATLRKSNMRLGTSGTIAYMSPESVKGGFYVDTAADIFSIGVMMFEMAYGFEPWGGLGGNALMENTPLPKLPLEFEEDWTLLMQSCLQYQPTKRPSAPIILDYLKGKTEIDAILKVSGLEKWETDIPFEKKPFILKRVMILALVVLFIVCGAFILYNYIGRNEYQHTSNSVNVDTILTNTSRDSVNIDFVDTTKISSNSETENKFEVTTNSNIQNVNNNPVIIDTIKLICREWKFKDLTDPDNLLEKEDLDSVKNAKFIFKNDMSCTYITKGITYKYKWKYLNKKLILIDNDGDNALKILAINDYMMKLKNIYDEITITLIPFY